MLKNFVDINSNALKNEFTVIKSIFKSKTSTSKVRKVIFKNENNKELPS